MEIGQFTHIELQAFLDQTVLGRYLEELLLGEPNTSLHSAPWEQYAFSMPSVQTLKTKNQGTKNSEKYLQSESTFWAILHLREFEMICSLEGDTPKEWELK